MTSWAATLCFFLRDLNASLAVDRFPSDSTQTLFLPASGLHFRSSSCAHVARSLLQQRPSFPRRRPRVCAHGILRAKCACVCACSCGRQAVSSGGGPVCRCGGGRGERRGGRASINQARLQRRRDLQLPSNSRTVLCFMSPDTLTVTTVTGASAHAGLGPAWWRRTPAADGCWWCNSYPGAILYQVHLCGLSWKP